MQFRLENIFLTEIPRATLLVFVNVGLPVLFQDFSLITVRFNIIHLNRHKFSILGLILILSCVDNFYWNKMCHISFFALICNDLCPSFPQWKLFILERAIHLKVKSPATETRIRCSHFFPILFFALWSHCLHLYNIPSFFFFIIMS